MDQIRIFKPVRAALDGDEPTIRVSESLEVVTGRFSKLYQVIPAGTRPTRAVHGNLSGGGLVLDTEGLRTTYRVRPCGTPLHSLM
jgi:hypothetical protein